MGRVRLLAPMALAALLALPVAAGWSAGAAQSDPSAELGAEPGADVARFHYADLKPAGQRGDVPEAAGTLALVFRDGLVNVPVAEIGTSALAFTGLTTRHLTLDFSGFAAARAPLEVHDLSSAALHVGVA